MPRWRRDRHSTRPGPRKRLRARRNGHSHPGLANCRRPRPRTRPPTAHQAPSRTLTAACRTGRRTHRQRRAGARRPPAAAGLACAAEPHRPSACRSRPAGPRGHRPGPPGHRDAAVPAGTAAGPGLHLLSAGHMTAAAMSARTPRCPARRPGWCCPRPRTAPEGAPATPLGKPVHGRPRTPRTGRSATTRPPHQRNSEPRRLSDLRALCVRDIPGVVTRRCGGT